jgi:tetratricopeptide (TPR) repeat protein
MIVKDEESNLSTCLRSAADLVDEVIVVDTGSTDHTREIAGSFGARVVSFDWVDDFSAARNESLRHATGRWIFWLDADEWLDAENRRRLKALFGGLEDENFAYVMHQLCTRQSSLTGPPHHIDQSIGQVRLFRNDPRIRWEHRVYEQILGGVRRSGGDLRHTDIVIQHPGYQDPDLHRRKIERNLRLAQLEIGERPDDPYVLYTIGIFQQLLGNPAGSLAYLRSSMGFLRPGASYGAKLFALTAQALARTGHPHEALAVCRAGRERYPENKDLTAQEPHLLLEASDVVGAEILCNRLTSQEAVYPAVLRHDLSKFAKHHLAMIYRGLRRLSDAELQWRELLDDAPVFALGWLELGELYLSLGRWAELDQVIHRVEVHLGRTEDAAVMRARGLLGRREFSAARDLLERVIALVPQSFRPRQALSHVLLFEGRDPAAAERALRDILRLDPGDAQALQNLEILTQRRAAQCATSPMTVGANHSR